MLSAYVFEWQKRFTRWSKWLSEQDGLKKQEWSEDRVSKTGNMWQSSVDNLNDMKKKGLEDYHWRFGLVWKVSRLDAFSIRNFLAKKNIAVQEKPPYLPDPAPSHFFPQLEEIIQGISSESVKAITGALTTELKKFIEESFFIWYQNTSFIILFYTEEYSNINRF